jgi:hypothetical protein
VKNHTLICITLVMVFCWFGETANAQWLNSSYNNNAICTSSSTQETSQLASDGNGGAIFTWGDSRSAQSLIFAQKINSSGVIQWDTNGVAICAAGTGGQGDPQLLSDGHGGAIITWTDFRDWPNTGV